MKLSFPAVKDAALYGLNVAFVQQPKGAIARHSANLARITYGVSVVGYAVWSAKQAYNTSKTNKQVDPFNSRAEAAYNKQVQQRAEEIEQNKNDTTYTLPEEIVKPALRKTAAVTLPLFRNIGKALLGYGMYAGAGELRSRAVSFSSKVASYVASKMQ